MAGVVLASGDQVQAKQLLDEATTVLRHTAPWFLSWTLYLRALLAVRRGNAREAITFVRESLTYIRALRDKFAFVCALVPLAAAAVMMGTTPGRRESWGLQIPPRNAPVPRSRIEPCRTFGNRRNDKGAHVSARIGGPEVTPPAVSPRRSR
jgi:hypothetical protein